MTSSSIFSRDLAAANEVAAQCRALGAEVLVLKADIAVDSDCRAMAAEVEKQLGRVDALVNNAGTTKFVPATDLEGLSAQDFQDIYAVNVIGEFQMIRAFAPLLRKVRVPVLPTCRRWRRFSVPAPASLTWRPKAH